MQDERRFGLDWLRIGAFGLLIPYHIGMYFVPWDWHVKSAHPQEWLELPMLALNPWRLLLLFVISGIASRAMLRKTAGAGRFLGTRSRRLLLPLLAASILIVAPQPWAELSERAGYAHGFWHFWIHDYFLFGKKDGVILPTYMHLWFVAYLWLYTSLLALIAGLPEAARAKLQRGFDRLLAGPRLLLLPIGLLFLARIALYPSFGETHALADDPYAHLVYGFAFFFGVGLGGAPSFWPRLVAGWKRAGLIGLAAFASIVGLDLTIPGESGPLELLVTRLARSVQAWGVVLALLGFAQAHLHRDGPIRAYLNEAIFPFYIVHQTIIIVAAHELKPFGLGPAQEFAIILAATVAGCLAANEIGRRVRWLRPLLGLRPAKRKAVISETGGIAALSPAAAPAPN